MVPFADALSRTAAAADRYQVSEDMTGLAARSLIQIPHRPRAHAGMRAMLEAVWLIADAHAGPHHDCGQCDAIRNALAVALAVMRAEMDVQFGRRRPD